MEWWGGENQNEKELFRCIDTELWGQLSERANERESSPGDTQVCVASQVSTTDLPRHTCEGVVWYIVVNFSTPENSKNDVGERDSEPQPNSGARVLRYKDSTGKDSCVERGASGE